jgi:hypothetical protein
MDYLLCRHPSKGHHRRTPMNHWTRLRALRQLLPLVALAILLSERSLPAAAVFTQHNDNNRSGDNLSETILNVSNVNTNHFGLLYSRAVDDQNLCPAAHPDQRERSRRWLAQSSHHRDSQRHGLCLRRR